MDINVTYTMQRYAAEIFRLQEFSKYVSLSDLADEMDASLQATSRMIQRLRNGGFLEHEHYQGVRLTTEGESIAMPALRRHRLAELFLVKTMGFGWDEVHEITGQFELGIDELLEERIAILLGDPARCPHGEPIPNRVGNLPRLNDCALVDKAAGSMVKISRVRIHEPARLRYVAELGLLPGEVFELVSIAPFHGPVRIRIHKKEQVLSYELAAALFVESA